MTGLIAACGGAVPDGTQTDNQTDSKTGSKAALVFTEPPVLERLPNQTTTLIRFATNRPVTAHYVAGDRWSYQTVDFTQTHYQPLPLLHQDAVSQYTVRISVTDRLGNSAEQVVQVSREFAALDQGFKPPMLNWQKGGQRPPYTVISFARYDANAKTSDGAAEPASGYSLLQAFDRNGNAIWSYQHDELVEQVVRRDSNSLTLLTPNGLLTVDLFGSSLGWVGGHAQQAPERETGQGVVVSSRLAFVGRLQRKVLALPDGNTLVMADIDTATPAVIEVDLLGTQLARWELPTLQGVRQISDGGLRRHVVPSDIAYNPATQTLVLSLPDQRMVLGLQRGTPNIQWVYTSRRDLPPPLQDKVLHSAQETSAEDVVLQAANSIGFAADGDLVLLDSAGPQQNIGDSRAGQMVRLRIDPATQTYRLVGHWPGQEGPATSHRITKQHGVQGTTPNVFWLLDDAGQALSAVDARTPQLKTTTLLSVEKVTERGQDSWAITDAVALDYWFGSPSYALAARRLGLVDEEMAGPAGFRSRSVSFHGLSLQPDLTVEGIDLSGDWEITIGDAGLVPSQLLSLQQDQVVVTVAPWRTRALINRLRSPRAATSRVCVMAHHVN